MPETRLARLRGLAGSAGGHLMLLLAVSPVGAGNSDSAFGAEDVIEIARELAVTDQNPSPTGAVVDELHQHVARLRVTQRP